MNSQALPYIILNGFLWGSNLVVVRFGLTQFETLPFIGLRLALAGLAHVAVYTFSRQRTWPRDRRLWSHSIVLGIFGTAVPMCGIVLSLSYLSSGMTAVFVTASPAFTVLLAHFLLADESLNRRKALGVALALGGALLLAFRGESGLPDVSQADPLGYVLVLAGVFSGSVMSIYARRYMSDYDAFDVATVRVLTAVIAINLPVLLFLGYDLSRVETSGVLALGYAAVFGVFSGLLLEFWIIKNYGATAVAMVAYVIPIVATAGGTLFLGEQITATILLGMAFIVGGIAILNQRRRPVKISVAP